MSKPKVIVLTSSYPKYKGDVNGNFVYELASRLQVDFEIFVIAPAFKGSPGFEVIEGINIYRHKQFITKNIELAYGIGIIENLKRNKLKYLLLPFYFFFQIQLLYRIIKKENINLVHAHWLIPNGFIAVLCKKIYNRNFRIISTIHGSDIWGFTNNIGSSIKKYTLKNIDSLTVVSNAIKEKVLELGYDEEILVYPMGLDTNLFSPSKRDDYLKTKLNIKGPFLLFVGIIVEQKGIRYLIQSMPKIISACPDSKLVVVGDGNLKDEMIELAKKLNVLNNVIFKGSLPHEELPSYFATADLLILPSFSEGWPLVVMEALSSSTPVVVTDIPVFKRHEQKDNLFSIVPVGNHNCLSVEVVKAILKGKTQIESNDRLRNYALNNFDWIIVSDKFKTLIKNILLK